MQYISKQGDYKLAGTLLHAKFPAGLRCVPANNIPEGEPGKQFWLAELHSEADQSTRNWFESYGILLNRDEVEEV